MSAEQIDQYLEQLDEPKRATLQRLRESILRVVPDAEQGLSYGVPAFRVGNRPVAGFSAARNHLSYLPHSGTVLGGIDPQLLTGHHASKGALRFPVDTPLSDQLVARLVEARLAELP